MIRGGANIPPTRTPVPTPAPTPTPDASKTTTPAPTPTPDASKTPTPAPDSSKSSEKTPTPSTSNTTSDVNEATSKVSVSDIASRFGGVKLKKTSTAATEATKTNQDTTANSNTTTRSVKDIAARFGGSSTTRDSSSVQEAIQQRNLFESRYNTQQANTNSYNTPQTNMSSYNTPQTNMSSHNTSQTIMSNYNPPQTNIDNYNAPISSTSNIYNVGSTDAIRSTSDVNMTPQQIENAYFDSGLLVRTVQSKNLGYEFNGPTGNLDAARQDAAQNNSDVYSRNWSLIKNDVSDQLYKMGPDAGAFSRSLGVIALPERTTDNIISVSDTDQSSKAKLDDHQYTMSSSDARQQLTGLTESLKTKTEEGLMNQNSEIKTFGLLADAMVGFVHSGDMRSLEADLKKIQTVLDNTGPEFDGRSFPVLEIETDSSGNSTFQEKAILQPNRT